MATLGEQIVWLIGCAVIAIGLLTVNEAVLEVTLLHAPVTTTL